MQNNYYFILFSLCLCLCVCVFVYDLTPFIRSFIHSFTHSSSWQIDFVWKLQANLMGFYMVSACFQQNHIYLIVNMICFFFVHASLFINRNVYKNLSAICFAHAQNRSTNARITTTAAAEQKKTAPYFNDFFVWSWNRFLLQFYDNELWWVFPWVTIMKASLYYWNLKNTDEKKARSRTHAYSLFEVPMISCCHKFQIFSVTRDQ